MPTEWQEHNSSDSLPTLGGLELHIKSIDSLVYNQGSSTKTSVQMETPWNIPLGVYLVVQKSLGLLKVWCFINLRSQVP